MIIKTFEETNIPAIVELWNTSVVPYSIYKPFTCESFHSKFVTNPCFDPEGFMLAYEGEELIGFGHAIVNQNEAAPGFITCIAIKRSYQRQGYGTKILALLEDYLKGKKKTLVRLYFGSPINLEWYIPDTNKADHPGAPAVAYNTPYYFLLLANGYNTNGQLDGYYLDIRQYEIPAKVIAKEIENEKNNYHITIYDEAKHHGFPELFEALKNPGWHDAVKSNLAKENPAPMLIAEKEGTILGWTGPMFTQDSGRGYFAGIGVHPETQGLGLGKSLFCHLCYESRKNGATFMSLFTGSDNPARNIYLYAGFKVRQSFAIMRKELA